MISRWTPEQIVRNKGELEEKDIDFVPLEEVKAEIKKLKENIKVTAKSENDKGIFKQAWRYALENLEKAIGLKEEEDG